MGPNRHSRQYVVLWVALLALGAVLAALFVSGLQGQGTEAQSTLGPLVSAKWMRDFRNTEMDIRDSGAVQLRTRSTYPSSSYTPDETKVSYSLSSEEVAALAQRFQAADFMNLRETYLQGTHAGTNLLITYHQGTRSKSLLILAGAKVPSNLTGLVVALVDIRDRALKDGTP